MGFARSDLVVGLGPSCRTAWNLRTFFGDETAYPFDWWITPTAAMLHILENADGFSIDFDDLVVTPRGKSVFNRRYNLLHHHDFPRSSDRRVLPLEREAVAQASEKYGALVRRMNAHIRAADETLFVLGGKFVMTEGDYWKAAPPALNRSVDYDEVEARLRALYGDRTRLYVFDVGDETGVETIGHRHIRKLVDDKRIGVVRRAPSYAEPAHLIQQALAEDFGRSDRLASAAA